MTMIEASSPLAGLQPPAFLGHCGFHQDPPSYLSLAQTRSLGAGTFNFKDMSMKRPMRHSNSDYFSMRPMRGSSPTASLAADLSQNFHITQSPQLPTPRRSLFSNNSFSGLNGQNSLTTPPIPTSSPGTDSMDMDLSPLPHKAPYIGYSTSLQSPTPDLTPNQSSLISVSVPSPATSEITSHPMNLTLPAEKRKSGPIRPSLSKFKGYSDNAIVPRKLASDSQLPPFKFGNYNSKPAASSSLSLSEIFQESPTQERSTARLSHPQMALPRPRPLSGLSSCSRNGSPIGQHMRKSSNPLVRPRKQFRRSLSMFEHPGDVMNQEKPTPQLLPSIMDVEPHHVPQLPHFVSDDQAGDLPRITKDIMVDVLDGKYNHLYEKLVIIDCRFEYEYLGGHIAGAVNFNDKEKLSSQLFDVEPTSKALLIFHCEYSAHRAPLMAKFIRNKDRVVNAERYPGLTYPEAYILDGGYSAFFKDHSGRCFPQNYVEMDAAEHTHACERGLGKVKQRTKLLRAQTYAFGDRSPGLDSSPTAMGRGRPDSDTEMDCSLEFTPVSHNRLGIDSIRQRSQRMLSY